MHCAEHLKTIEEIAITECTGKVDQSGWGHVVFCCTALINANYISLKIVFF